MSTTGGLVSIVDDDESVREALQLFLGSIETEAVAFVSAETFLQSEERSRTACLLLDYSLPGMNGRELQQTLMLEERPPAIIFITASADERFQKLVLSSGAVACLQKPFAEADLLSALRRALGRWTIGLR